MSFNFFFFFKLNILIGTAQPKQGCFWKVLDCREKVKNGDWDRVDCKSDKETLRCCHSECSKSENDFLKIFYTSITNYSFYRKEKQHGQTS